MKLDLLFIFLMIAVTGYSQSVSVNPEADPAALVSSLLNDGCVQVSNESFSSLEAVSYFNNNGGNFPINEGVIIRSGRAQNTAGSYNGSGLSTQLNTNSDADLVALNESNGQSSVITDVAYLQFDFVPLSSNFSFNFLFASNEYGEWQCVSSDVFAFLLTDIETGETRNLAVIPGSNTPVSVRNIKDSAYNNSCGSDNANLFSSYEVQDPANSSVNMRGYTQVMNASANITPGKSYRLRLVIGDSNDADYDSAIFLRAGSFRTNVNLGADFSLCTGDEKILNTNLDASVYQHTWYRNGQVIAGETGSILAVSTSGSYTVEISRASSNCLASDTVNVTGLQVNDPQDLLTCYDASGVNSFDLSQNDEEALGLNPSVFEVLYYADLNDLVAGNAIPESELTNFSGNADQRIYFKIQNNNTGNTCSAIYSFDLLVNDEIVPGQAADLEYCVSQGGTSVSVDLNLARAEIINGQNHLDLSYYNSQAAAEAGNSAIADPSSYNIDAANTESTFWVRLVDTRLPSCYAVTSFNVILNMPPPVTTLDNVVACSAYELPVIENGVFYTGANQTGDMLSPGDLIEETGTIYIFSGPDENGCVSQSSFRVWLMEDFRLQEYYCDHFTIPQLPAGGFYTQAGGPEGAGEEIPVGTTLYTSQTVYFYGVVDDEVCKDEGLNLVIRELPPVDQPEDIVTCNSYELPPLTNGDYFSRPNGEGRRYNAGDVITTSQTIYVYSDDGYCGNQNAFNVNITPVFENIDACGSYILPEVNVGGYFTEANGAGQQIPELTEITSTTIVYYYAETTSTPNCTSNSGFQINITPIPPVDALNDITICDGDSYVLPAITNGQYFTKPNRRGQELLAGEAIIETTTLYINNEVNGCSDETSFTVTVRELPPVDNFSDVYTCSPYELPELTNGRYYTQPAAQGEELFAGEIIAETITIYIYREWDDYDACYNEDFFTVYYEGIDVGEFEDIATCDSYILPEIEVGNYYTSPRGAGDMLVAGDAITSTQQIYVYARRGTRFFCEDENTFTVTISQTPELPVFENTTSCGEFELPDLSNENDEVTYFWRSNTGEEMVENQYTITEPGTYDIYVLANAKSNQDCYVEAEFSVTVYPLREIEATATLICRNPETGEVESPAYVTTGIDPAEFEVNWYFNNTLVHTGVDFEAFEVGEYTIETVKLNPEVGADCNYAVEKVQVKESGLPIISVDVSQPFSDVANIEITVERGYGEYEYKLDDGEYQLDNIFKDVEVGKHYVYVRGVGSDCGEAIVEVTVVKYPKYFTPNQDGYNDTWNITSLQDHPEAKINIYDRYGKLIKQILPSSSGWNGLYNGRDLPSDDYWFKVWYEDEEDGLVEFAAHFTLKR